MQYIERDEVEKLKFARNHVASFAEQLMDLMGSRREIWFSRVEKKRKTYELWRTTMQ